MKQVALLKKNSSKLYRPLRARGYDTSTSGQDEVPSCFARVGGATSRYGERLEIIVDCDPFLIEYLRRYCLWFLLLMRAVFHLAAGPSSVHAGEDCEVCVKVLDSIFSKMSKSDMKSMVCPIRVPSWILHRKSIIVKSARFPEATFN